MLKLSCTQLSVENLHHGENTFSQEVMLLEHFYGLSAFLSTEYLIFENKTIFKKPNAYFSKKNIILHLMTWKIKLLYLLKKKQW